MRRATWTVPSSVDSVLFQSTLSMRRATAYGSCSPNRKQFQSTLSMRRATFVGVSQPHDCDISIHALHEESDGKSDADMDAVTQFQSTLSMRRATCAACGSKLAWVFQSTLSMRRATMYSESHQANDNISIHALHEESDLPLECRGLIPGCISIHALHEESDFSKGAGMEYLKYFNPRSP